MSRRTVRSAGLAFVVLGCALGCATASNDVGTNGGDGGGVHDSGASGDVPLGDTGLAFDVGDARADSGVTSDTGSIDSTSADTGVDLDTGGAIDSGVGVDSGVDTGIDSGIDTGVDAGSDTFVPPPDTGFDAGTDAVTGCSTVEDFESGGFGASWVSVAGGTPGTFSSASAHDGAFGWGSTATSDWFYTTTPTIGASGDRLTAWVRGNTGRVYLGFSASASGAKSFVFAPNTGDIRFQDNAAWGFTEMTSTPTTIVASHWYKMEIVFGGGTSVTGHLYDSDGTTLLATVSQTYASLAPGGVAIRSFGVGAPSDVDTIQFCAGP